MREYMGIAGYAIFSLSWSLNLLLVWRCFITGQWRLYGFFSGYVIYTLSSDLVLFFLFLARFRLYANLNWVCYALETLLWFAIAWEVFRHTFSRESAVRSIAAKLLVAVLSLLALLFYLSGPQPGVYLKAEFVRKIALTIVVWMAVVLTLARYYRVRMSRNVRGMAVGLLVLASSHIANFAAVEMSRAYAPIWSLVDPSIFALTLLIWTVALWSYAPNPRPVAAGKSMPGEALSHWEQRWAALGITIRKIIKQQ